MKLSSSQYPYPPKRINATEFAAALLASSNITNSNNTIQYAQSILYTLQRFVYTIRLDNEHHHRNVTNDSEAIYKIHDYTQFDPVYDDDDNDHDHYDDSDEASNSSRKDDQLNEGDEEDEEIPMKKQRNDNIEMLDDTLTSNDSTVDPTISPLKKKVKKSHDQESWKDDTASYNVPFVGTNIASFDRPSIVLAAAATSNPTTGNGVGTSQSLLLSNSLLHTYLKGSPNAIELCQNELIAFPSIMTTTSSKADDNQWNSSSTNKRNIHNMLQLSSTTKSSSTSKRQQQQHSNRVRYQKKLSKAIIRVTIQAMTEIIMVYIPSSTSSSGSEQRQSSYRSNTSDNINTQQQNLPRFLIDMITQKVPIILELLIQDVKLFMKTTSTTNLKRDKGKDNAVENDKTNDRYDGIDGILMTPIIIFLLKCTQLSISMTKTILRHIEQIVPNSILRTLFTYHCFTRNHSINTDHSLNRYDRISSVSYSVMIHFVSTITEQLITTKQQQQQPQFYDVGLIQYICNSHTSTGSHNSNSINNSTLKNEATSLRMIQKPQQQTSSNKVLGVLFLALQFRGITIPSSTNPTVDSMQYDNNVYVAVVRLLQTTRQIIMRLFDPSATTKHYYLRMLYDLFTTRSGGSGNNECCLQQFVTLMNLYAPPLINYEHVLSLNDDSFHENDTIMKDDGTEKSSEKTTESKKLSFTVGVEARRLLFLLLSDSIHSPILRNMSIKDRATPSTKIESNTTQLIVRILLEMVSLNQTTTNIPYSSKKEMQRFLLFVTIKSPILFPAIMRVVHIDDLNSTTPDNIGRILYQMNFVSTMLRHGPSVTECLPIFQTSSSLGNEIDNELPSHSIDSSNKDDSSINDERILSTFLPVHLKKLKFIKLLTHTNDNILLAFEAYKLLVSSLRRCQTYFSGLNVNAANNTENKTRRQSLINKFYDVMESTIPDLSQIVLGVSKLTSSAQSQNKYTKSKIMIVSWACEAIQVWCSILDERIEWSNNGQDVLVDIYRILPTSARVFLSSPTVIQRTILATIKTFLTIQKSTRTSFVQPNLFRSIMEIALLTRSETIYQEARSVAIIVLCFISGPNSVEEKRYEASCWVDGLTITTLNEFCSLLLKDSDKGTTLATLQLMHAWRKANLPNQPQIGQVSSFLIRAIKNLKQSSKILTFFIVQVTTRCILSSASPLPLAVMILEYNLEEVVRAPMYTQRLVKYAQILVHYERYTAARRTASINRLLESTFTYDSYPVQYLNLSIGCTSIARAYFNDNCIVLSRQLRLLTVINEESLANTSFIALLQRLLPVIIMAGMQTSVQVDYLQLHDFYATTISSDHKVIDCLLISFISLKPGTANDHLYDRIRTTSLATSIQSGELLPDCISLLFSRLYFYLIGMFLPDDFIFSILHHLLFKVTTKPKEFDDHMLRLTAYFLKISRSRKVPSNKYTATTTQLETILLQTWIDLDTADIGNERVSELLLELELTIISIFSAGNSSLVLLAYDCDVLIRKFIELQLPRDRSYQSDRCILTLMVSSDPLRFGPPMFEIVNEMYSIRPFRRLFDCGLLDKAFQLVLEYHAITATASRESVSRIITLLNARLSKAISEEPDDDVSNLIAVAYKALSLNDVTIAYQVMVDSLADLLSRIIKRHQELNSRKKDSPTFIHSIHIESATFICSTSRTGNKKVEQLSSTLLLYLCTALSPVLRADQVRKKQSSSNDPDLPLKLATSLQKLLSGAVTFDLDLLKENGSLFLKGLVKNCLLRGMRIETNCKDVSIMSLQIVQSLLNAIHGEGNFLGAQTLLSSESITTQVFGMITTHSKFSLLMSSSNYDYINVEIARIIYTCFSHSNNIQFDRRVWTSMLACYNAGVDEKDLLLRYVLNEYTMIAKKSSHVLYTDQMRWGDSAHQDSLPRGWDWLPDSIEFSRVQATLNCFPVEDSIILGNILTLNAKNCYFDSDNVGTKKDNETSNNKQRYSPAFLLPLIANALFDEVAIRAKTSGSSKPQRDCPTIAQRLQERGALALTLMSLSSKCLSMRKLSVAILGLFIEAVTSQDAHKSISWKERPQIAMLLISVQRSLALRCCNDYKDMASEFIPQLPGFSAIFLARASIVLAHPGDTLYTAINKALLRSEEDSGGFQDLTRLPAFVSLFCSSADSPDQVIAERRFALNLVKDGLTEASNYKLVTQCHCPELILTSIDCSLIRPSFGFTDESQLLFATLSKIITTGAERAASHLIDRLGLVSWTRTLIIGKPDVSAHMRLCYLRLLKDVLNLARLPEASLTDEDFLASTTGVAQAVLSLCQHHLNKLSLVVSPVGAICSELKYACEVLHLLAEVQYTVDSDLQLSPIDNVRQSRDDGIDIRLAFDFLFCLRAHPTYMRNSLFAICTLPMSFVPQEALDFHLICTTLIDICGSLQGFTDETKLALLNRLHNIHEQKKCDIKDWEVIHICLLIWHKAFLHTPKLRQKWFGFIKCLLYRKTDLGAADSLSSNESVWLDLILRNE